MSTATCEFAPGVTTEGFLKAIDELQKTLAGRLIGRERAWADEVGTSLEQVMTALRGHIAAAQVGPHPPPMPHSWDRHANEMRLEHFHLLEETCALQKGIANVMQAFSSPPYTAFDKVLEGGEQLVRDLHRHQEGEATWLEQHVESLSGGI